MRQAEIDDDVLADALNQFRSVFEVTSDAMAIRDLETLQLVDVNQAYCQMRQVSRLDLLGTIAVPGLNEENYQRYIREINEVGRFRWEATEERPDGTILHMDLLGTLINYQGKPHLLVTIQNISQRVAIQQQLEERVLERTQELESLLQTSHDLSATLELRPLLQLILERMKTIFDYQVAMIYRLQDDDRLELISYDSVIEATGLQSSIHMGEFPFYQKALESRQPILVSDTHDKAEFADSWVEMIGSLSQQAHSWLNAPMFVGEKASGLLVLGHETASYYGNRHAKLAMAFANQAAIAVENTYLYEQAQVLASLEERRHLARELHDSVSQALYGVALGARTARMLLDQDPSKLAEPLDYILEQAEAGLTEMRALIFELRPEILEAEGLVAALNKRVDALRIRHNLQITASFSKEPDVRMVVKEALYRVVQEATHNIVKHAKATAVEISLMDRDGLHLLIIDDGRGFDTSLSFPNSMGLQSMRERIERIGGSFMLNSTIGKGTRVEVQLNI